MAKYMEEKNKNVLEKWKEKKLEEEKELKEEK